MPYRDPEDLKLELATILMPPQDYAVFGSGCLLAHGLITEIHDFDVIARGKAWEMAKDMGLPCVPKFGVKKEAKVFDGDIEVFEQWAPGEWDTDMLIDTADIIENIRFVKLEYVLAFKKMLKRPKDLPHIAILEKYLQEKAEA